MNKLLASLPLLWGTLASSSITESTEVSLSLFIAGIVGTVALVWRARGDRDRIIARVKKLEERMAAVDGTDARGEEEDAESGA